MSSRVSRLSEDIGGPAELSMKYKEIISTLPKRESGHNTYLDHYQYKGFWLPLYSLEQTLALQETFKAQPDDIFICSSQKTGTTWLKALAFSIMTREHYHDNPVNNPLLTKGPHECIPCLEVDRNQNPAFLDTELPLLATHLPYTCLPRSVLQSNCKIIYICREPKDTFVSLWHYMQKLGENIDLLRTNAVPLEQELKWFCEGKSTFGPYWDHVLEYQKASVNRPERVFFLKYEDLKSDTLCYVKKLAEFMGVPFSQEEENQGVAEKVVARCHFGSLSNLEVNKNGWLHPEPYSIKNSVFFRKGEIGDWKNILTEDMAKSIDRITREKLNLWALTPISTQSENYTKD